jgi:hypothetical protein
VSRSKGTKETQGINGDATNLQRMLELAAKFGGDRPMDPCPYDRHRSTDWRGSEEHPWVCGICHPPAAEWLVGERRASADLPAV